MGTNYYIKGHRRDDDPEWHIGKRSAAGYYCWDCKQTLCATGIHGIHDGATLWHHKCPHCGKIPDEETLAENSVGRELGFNKTKPKAKHGVKSCSSFNWAMNPSVFDCKIKESRAKKPIENEYGDKFTLKEFRAVLSECPIMYYHSIDVRFS